MSIEAVPNKLLTVTVHSANIATTLYTVTAGGAPCDGLLFGDTVTTTTQHLRDDDDMATVTESRAVITSTTCCASTCSFYDEAGELSEAALGELTAQQPAPLLGWLVYRPAASGSASGAVGASTTASAASCGSLRPSMRESAATLALLRRQLARHGGRQAVLLLLITTGTDHNGATLTWQFRCFQARLATGTGDMLLEPVELHTLNLGGHTGQGAYQQLTAATTALPAGASSPRALQHAVQVYFSSAASPPHGGGVIGAVTPGGTALPPAVAATVPGCDAAALTALAAGSREQVRAVKAHCEALLGGLHDLCGQAGAGEAAVALLRQRRDALLAQLAARGQ